MTHRSTSSQSQAAPPGPVATGDVHLSPQTNAPAGDTPVVLWDYVWAAELLPGDLLRESRDDSFSMVISVNPPEFEEFGWVRVWTFNSRRGFSSDMWFVEDRGWKVRFTP